MDIEIDIECAHCGYAYRDGFRAMPHGKVLKCPLCCSSELQVKGDLPMKELATMDGFEVAMRPSAEQSKFKL